MAGREGGTKAVVAALLANLGIAVTKFVAFSLTGPRRCWPRPSTRWPTPATRGCCCSAAAGQAGGDAAAPVRLRPRAVHLRVRGRRWCCSSWAASSPCTRPGTSSPTRSRSELALGAGPRADRGDRPGELLVPHRDRGDEQGPRRVVVGAVRAARQGPELPVILLEDLRRAGGSSSRSSASCSRWSPGTASGTRRAARRSACCWSWSSAILAIEMKSLLVGEGATPEQTSAIEAAIRNGAR